MARTYKTITAVIAAAVVLGGCADATSDVTPHTISPGGAVSERSDVAAGDAGGHTAVVTRVIDGDTLVIDGDVRVRLIGIDTPERGECGHPEATAFLTQTEGREVTLVPGARTDTDHYDRLLRYVELDGRDMNLELISNGFAVARYDSRDGYGEHPREQVYVTTDAATPHLCDRSDPHEGSQPGVASPGTAPSGVSYRNCAEAREAGAAPILAGEPGYGAHLDGDGDGIACE